MEEAELWFQQQEVMRSESRTVTQASYVSAKRWSRPSAGTVKCSLSSKWINSTSMCGGAWILRNHIGEVLFHARDAFVPISDRLAAELRCIIWVLKSLKDLLHVDGGEIWSDYPAAIAAINNRNKWPRYNTFLDQVHQLNGELQGFVFFTSSFQANSIATDIARSVTRDGRFMSYL
ncbi:hypothetical protein V5N11_033566 [Cardamine amara subsp. amara]|uniref:RNase H type-1 domain-containing protein n=1 Tax=Cardamine amara subsp. amara TaxID=228776 RepID=A0ABD1C6S4_CARAN